jgi:hypothetical protein
MTLVCGQAQTAEAAASRGNVAPRGCFYAKVWRPLANVATPKEFNRFPASTGSSEKFLFGGLSGAHHMFEASQSNKAFGVTPVQPPAISPVAVWLYRTPSFEVICGMHGDL